MKSGTGVEYYWSGSKAYEGQFGGDKWNGYGVWYGIMGETRYDGWFIDGEPEGGGGGLDMPVKKKSGKRKIVYRTPQIFVAPAPVGQGNNCSKCNTLLCESCHHDLSPRKKVVKKKKKKPGVKPEEVPAPVIESDLSPKPCERCTEHDTADAERLNQEEED